MTNPTYDDILTLAQHLSAADRRRLIADLSASSPQLSAEEIINCLNAHAADLQRLGVAAIGLYGAYARGDARLDSSIEIIVRMSNPAHSEFDLFGVKDYLQKLFDTPIALISADAPTPAVRRVIKSALYAKQVESTAGGYTRSESRWPYVKKVRGRHKPRSPRARG